MSPIPRPVVLTHTDAEAVIRALDSAARTQHAHRHSAGWCGSDFDSDSDPLTAECRAALELLRVALAVAKSKVSP